jgi:hypothetical protein
MEDNAYEANRILEFHSSGNEMFLIALFSIACST